MRASMAISLFLMMILVSFLAINNEYFRVAADLQPDRHDELERLLPGGCRSPASTRSPRSTGWSRATPFCWYGGKYGEETVPFAQFAVDADTFFTIYDELTIPATQLKAFREDKAGCVIGRMLDEDAASRSATRCRLKADAYPFDLTLTIRGIYDGPVKRDRRMCVFHWEYLDEGLKRTAPTQAGNAGMVVAKCRNAELMTRLSRQIDNLYVNSDRPARTQTEGALSARCSPR